MMGGFSSSSVRVSCNQWKPICYMGGNPQCNVTDEEIR